MTRIALDVHMIGARETGNETYATELAAALGRLGGYTYLLYTPQPAALPPQLRDQPALAARSFPDLPSAVRIPWLYPRLVRADAARLLHMMYVAPPHVACPVVLTVHDVSYRVFPEFFSPSVRLHLDLLVGHSVRHAARVITGSESARQDVIRYYHPPAERVVVIPAAAGAQYRPQAPEEVARVRAAYHLPARYFLAVGNLQPRKNLIRLIEAFTAVAGEAPDVQLILVGRSTWRGWEVAGTVARLGLEARVRCTGYVPDADLPGLYAGALGFCYPSLYEGFGLPPLEAMACGTPTITSNVSSLPEVVGDAALMVDPLAVADIAAALRRLLTDEAARCEYRRRGLTRAPQFSWARTALQTRDVYDVVVACRCGRYSDLCTCRRVPVGRV
jgi:glycosyltransferase involved in cell wall biosynthesis